MIPFVIVPGEQWTNTVMFPTSHCMSTVMNPTDICVQYISDWNQIALWHVTKSILVLQSVGIDFLWAPAKTSHMSNVLIIGYYSEHDIRTILYVALNAPLWITISSPFFMHNSCKFQAESFSEKHVSSLLRSVNGAIKKIRDMKKKKRRAHQASVYFILAS